ncbi:uncharacterized protein C10orf95-like [Cervus canadensis]|uniref:uncharacterized protein C10orf95-like n=1 Tax=Cervus canadensis TaxID=1574408 RepID=UPI001C9E4D38|nr:uncharacterized protein C10orf95-like [Cervus canadensis]
MFRTTRPGGPGARDNDGAPYARPGSADRGRGAPGRRRRSPRTRRRAPRAGRSLSAAPRRPRGRSGAESRRRLPGAAALSAGDCRDGLGCGARQAHALGVLPAPRRHHRPPVPGGLPPSRNSAGFPARSSPPASRELVMRRPRPRVGGRGSWARKGRAGDCFAGDRGGGERGGQ